MTSDSSLGGGKQSFDPLDPRLDVTTPLKPSSAAAAIVVVDNRYLLQHRDNKRGIFFPGHWCCFGGAVEAGETPEQGLIRELHEEIGLTLQPGTARYFSRLDYDLGFTGLGTLWRYYYEVKLEPDGLDRLRLGEGSAMRLFTPAEILTASVQFTPYDAFMLWFHINRARLHEAGSG